MKRRLSRLQNKIRTRTITKIKYRTRSTPSVMKKRYRSRRSGGGRGLPFVGGLLRNPWIQKTALGLGMGTIVALAASRLAPQYTQLASIGGAFLGGGIEGVIGGEAIKLIAGAPSAISGNSGARSTAGFL